MKELKAIMSGLVTGLCLVSVISCLFNSRARAEWPGPKFPWLPCITVVVVVGGGTYVTTKIIIPLCRNIISNFHWRETNWADADYLIATGPYQPVKLEWTSTPSETNWQGPYDFEATQTSPTNVTLVVRAYGVPISTNYGTPDTNMNVWFDLRGRLPLYTNDPIVQYFRLSQPSSPF